jgi:hypothetical protein
MSQTIDWKDVSDEKAGKSSGKSNFLRLNAGTHVVRLLGPPIAMNKFMVQGNDQRWRSAVCEDAENNPVTKNHGVNPSERYAINVIDRADGELKILEGGVKVFGEFKKYFTMTGNNPGAKEGADFKIVVTGAGRSKKIITTFDRKNSLTEDEVAYVKGRGGLNKLEDIFKVTPNDELEAKLFGEDVVAPGSPSPQTASADTGIDAPTSNIAPNTEEVGDDLPF